MSVKIRLQRQGRSKAPFYHVVVADSRAPRDGKFIEKIGSYLPQTQPATIDLDVDRAVYWLQNGAQPTDTCRAILSYKGAMMKRHLSLGVAKGAITQEQADAKFAAWENEKITKIEQHKTRVSSGAKDKLAAKLADETKASAARAEKIAAKIAAANAEAQAAEATAEETPAMESAEEAPAAETTVESTEAPAE
jgi:small subunit ribosomal protein S16